MRNVLRPTMYALALLLACSVWISAQSEKKAPSGEPKAPATAKPASRKARLRSKAHSVLIPGKCPDSGGQGHSEDYEIEVKPGACTNNFDVDAFLLHPSDDHDALCVDLSSGSEVTWSTADDSRTIKVKRIASRLQDGHPFKDPVPAPVAGPGGHGQVVHSGPIRPDAALKSTVYGYKFKSFVEVKDKKGTQCIDPHIYTDCSPSCGT